MHRQINNARIGHGAKLLNSDEIRRTLKHNEASITVDGHEYEGDPSRHRELRKVVRA